MSKPLIPPTVGRVVWFYPAGSTAFFGAVHDPVQPMAALISFVHSDRMVNLHVIDHAGACWAVTSVQLHHGDETTGDGSMFCAWMPFQRGQAKAQEAAATSMQPPTTMTLEQARGIQPGDKVMLKTGGPAMCAGDTNFEGRRCFWIAGEVEYVSSISIPDDCLMLVRNPDPAENHKLAALHAVAYLYPAIRDAMKELSELPPGFSWNVDRAWNHLHAAFWSETPAPAAALPLRPESPQSPAAIESKVYTDGTSATGSAPLPALSPSEQDASEKASAPRVSLAQILALVKSETYTLLPNGRTTVCQLTLENDFTVEGQSACVSAKAYDETIGQEIAKQNAIEAIWPLEGYLLAQRLHDASKVQA